MRVLRLRLLRCSALALVAGCHHHGYNPGMLSKEGYRYRAGSAVIGPARDTLRVAVVVVNESKEMRGITLNYCRTPPNVVTARLSAQGRSWSSKTPEEKAVVFHDSAGNVIEQACVASLMLMTFPPGHTMTFVLKTPVKDILGDSLPPARYHVTARLWDAHLNAGEVNLSRQGS